MISINQRPEPAFCLHSCWSPHNRWRGLPMQSDLNRHGQKYQIFHQCESKQPGIPLRLESWETGSSSSSRRQSLSHSSPPQHKTRIIERCLQPCVYILLKYLQLWFICLCDCGSWNFHHAKAHWHLMDQLSNNAHHIPIRPLQTIILRQAAFPFFLHLAIFFGPMPFQAYIFWKRSST